MLKAYSKEVIRQQPENIIEFSARYFAQLDRHEEVFEAGKRYGSDLVSFAEIHGGFAGDGATRVSQDALIDDGAEADLDTKLACVVRTLALKQ
jgi:hypothetical protein